MMMLIAERMTFKSPVQHELFYDSVMGMFTSLYAPDQQCHTASDPSLFSYSPTGAGEHEELLNAMFQCYILYYCGVFYFKNHVHQKILPSLEDFN